MADVELRAALTAAWVAKLEADGRIHRCGDCSKWMTRSCPQERLGNDGRSRGPSSRTISCPEFRTRGVAAPLTKQLPMVPTNHMMNAAVNAWHSWKSRDSGGNVQLLGKLMWEHMVDAAPEPGAWDDTSGVDVPGHTQR